MRREIELDGGETTVVKALGTSGNQMPGRLLMRQVSEMGASELIETLVGLIDRGYVLASKVNVMKIEDIERSMFRVNPSYARDLRDAMRGGAGKKDKERRRRRA